MAEKKRSAGRPPKNAPVAKKAKTAGPAKAGTPKEQTPVVEIVEEEREATPLPNRVAESKALPSLSRPQPLDVADDEYQSVGASGVLAASLERSRQKWVSGSFFQKYWTKTSTRKDAPPPPPNNPQKSWMKDIGSCTITIEPLIIDATVFYVKEPGMAGPVAQYHPAPQRQQQAQYQAPPKVTAPVPAPSPYGTPYRQQPQPQPQPHAPMQTSSQPNNYYQPRPLPPASSQPHTNPDGRILPPIMPAHSLPPPVAPRPAPAPPQAPPQPNKPSPDPVIQMLATRASTDHELKSLMKVVATGNANQEQLRIFQRHIDELTAIINRNKAQQPPQPVQQPPTQNAQGHPGPYGSNVPSRTSTPGVPGPPQLLPRPGPVATPPPQPQKHANQYTANQSHNRPQQNPSHPPPQKYYPPAQQPSLPIVLEFQGPNASPDRFRFPEYTILEFLTPHMLLASFLVIRKGDGTTVETPKPSAEAGAAEAVKEETDQSKSKDIYEPITLKITVEEGQKGRDLLGFIQRSVKPAADTRAWMTEQIFKCTRAEIRYLALRLPHKSQIRESTEDASKEATPVVMEKKKAAPRKSMDKRPKEEGKEKEKEGEAVVPVATPQVASTDGAVVTAAPSDTVPIADGSTAVQVTEGAPTEAAATSTTPAKPAEPAVGRRSSRRVRNSDAQMTDA